MIKYYEFKVESTSKIKKSYDITDELEKKINELIIGVRLSSSEPENESGKLQVMPMSKEPQIAKVLYTNKNESEEKLGTWKGIKKTSNYEILIEANAQYLKYFEDYLLDKNFTLKRIDEVSYCSYTFCSNAGHEEYKKDAAKMTENYVKTNYPNLQMEIEVNNEVQWKDTQETGTVFHGVIYGGIKEVLEVENFMMNNSLGTNIKYSSLNFSKENK